jgi:hypothetical protein
MHGQQTVKICDAKQSNQVYQYKNTKIKLYKSNAPIWCNKTCRIKQLIPTYDALSWLIAKIMSEKSKHVALLGK